MWRFVWILAIWPFGLGAQEADQVASPMEIVALSGEEIAQVLPGRTLLYPNWPKDTTQTFYASGRTLYDAGRAEWGYWAVRGDQYCSQWPPGDVWTCYDMARFETGVRFISEDGSFSEGFFAP